MIRLQSESVKVAQVIVAQVGDEWVVAAIDAAGVFHRMTEEEDLRLEHAQKVAVMAKDAINAGRDEVKILTSWVRDQVSDILYPGM